jgi:ribose-phosphate pyrophosphokinase
MIDISLIKVVSCAGGEHLAKIFAQSLNVDLIISKISRFTGHERLIEIDVSLRNTTVVIVQSFSGNVNNDIIELLLTIDAAKNAGAANIHLILPYMPYSRQDRQISNYSSVGMNVVANLIDQSQIDTITVLDIHAFHSLAWFHKPIFNISSMDIISRYMDLTDIVLVMPDKGAVIRNAAKDVVYLEKTRGNGMISFVLHGDVKGQECIIVDDMIDSGQTLCRAADKLIEYGAKSVSAYVTHAFLSETTCNLVNSSAISKLIVSNSISNIYRPSVLEVIDITDMILDNLKKHLDN